MYKAFVNVITKLMPDDEMSAILSPYVFSL